MSVSIPQPFRSRIEGGIGPVTMSPVTVAGIPDSFDIDITGIPVVHLAVDDLPTIHLSIDNIPKIQFGVDPVELRLTEFPSIRGHLPADFSVGVSVMGLELAAIRLCGEAQIITEPYEPNPCEGCGPRGRATPVGALPDRAVAAAASPAAAAKSKG
jgi:hypothetical protein